MPAGGYDREVGDVTVEAEQILAHLAMVMQTSQALVAFLAGAAMLLMWSGRAGRPPPLRRTACAADHRRPYFSRPMK